MVRDWPWQQDGDYYKICVSVIKEQSYNLQVLNQLCIMDQLHLDNSHVKVNYQYNEHTIICINN